MKENKEEQGSSCSWRKCQGVNWFRQLYEWHVTGHTISCQLWKL